MGHRVVHGGEKLNQPMVIDAAVKEVIREYFDLAPLHNPPNLEGIEAAETAFPQAVHVGIFDTAFHSTIPAHAFMYALPLELYRNDKIRRYGFHGISHQNVSLAAAKFLTRPPEEPQPDHLPPGQRLQHNRRAGRPQSGHQHGPHAVGGVGHGHPLRRYGPGHCVAPDRA